MQEWASLFLKTSFAFWPMNKLQRHKDLVSHQPKERAGRSWRKGFMDRKPWLRKKNAQNLSAARAIATNSVQVDKLFDLLEKWVRDWEIEFKLNHIWNVDETGITDVPKERKVIQITGEHVFQAVADEKGTTTTVMSFASAGGLHVPPMVIFKAGRVKDIWREAAPSGYTIKCSESGYINADLFADYGANFLNFLKEKKTTRKWAEESTPSRFAQQPLV